MADIKTNNDSPSQTIHPPSKSLTMHCNALAGACGVRHPDIKISGVRFNLMKLPCVYAWIRNDEWLYVGLGTRGLSRPLDYGHHVLKDFQDQDVLYIWRFKKKESAVQLEERLIAEQRPRFNIAGKPPYPKTTSQLCSLCGTSFQAKTKWQRYCSPVCRWKDWNINHPNRSEQIVISVDS